MTIFQIEPQDIEQLSDSDLRALVGYLCEEEARAHGHSPAAVTYGGHQNAPDGGIDVRVALPNGSISGYVPALQTGFQAKAEDMPPNAIAREMAPNGVLRPVIVDLASKSGAYIIVSSKGSVSDSALPARRNAMAQALSSVPAAGSLHVDFYDRRRMASWVNQHAGLIPWVRNKVGRRLSGWRPFEDWSSSPNDLTDDYFTDAGLRLSSAKFASGDGLTVADGLKQIRGTLANPKGVVRLVGLSGVGKTRFIQALFDSRIGDNHLSPHLAVYADLADEPDPVPQDLSRQLMNSGRRCVLIVDNCGVALHRKLAAQVRGSGGALSLVTVEYDIADDEPEGTEVFRLEPASSEVIEKILQRKHPNLSDPELNTITAFSEGNFRIALALADTAANGVSLANLKDSDLFDRLFSQRHEKDHDLLKAAKVASLVYSFDAETREGAEAELPVLAALAGQSMEQFHAHIAELARRQLVQKRSKWRALLPHALAHRLAKQALQDIPEEVLQKAFTQDAPIRLAKSFSRRLGYLHDVPEAQKIVARWLGDGGWLSNTADLSPIGITLFENIAPVNPAAILGAIDRAKVTIRGAQHNESLRQSLTGILRSIAYEPDNFEAAALLIVKLAASSSNSNSTADAINVFKSLFYIYLSGSHASPEQRVAALRQLLGFNTADDDAFAMAGIESMLECGHFSSSYGFEFGARKRNYGYQPRTYGEIDHWYSLALVFCREAEALPRLRERIRRLVAAKFAEIVEGTGLIDTLLSLADDFVADGGWPASWVAVRRAIRFIADKNRPEDSKKLEAFAAKLKPESLEQKIGVYLLPEDSSSLDIVELDIADDDRFEKAIAASDAISIEIGRELATDEDALSQHLPALFASKSQRVWLVGRTIGSEAREPEKIWRKLVPAFVEAMANGKSTSLMGAFLSGLAERDRDLTSKLLDEALETAELQRFFVHFQSSAGVDEAGAERLKRAVAIESVPIESFAALAYGRCCDDLGSTSFRELVSAISQRAGGTRPALEVVGMRAFSRRSAKKKLDVDEKSAGRDLIAAYEFKKGDNSEPHRLSELARACLADESDEPAARNLCRNLLEAITARRIQAWDYDKLVGELAKSFPRVVLDVLVEQKRLQSESRRQLFSDLRFHQPCPLDNIDEATMLDWAREAANTRFIYLAEAIRPWQRADHQHDQDASGVMEWKSAGLRLLREAPDPHAIGAIYADRCVPTSWSGSRAEIIAGRLRLIDELGEDQNPLIAAWAKQVSAELTIVVDRERQREARESKSRDERFDW